MKNKPASHQKEYNIILNYLYNSYYLLVIGISDWPSHFVFKNEKYLVYYQK